MKNIIAIILLVSFFFTAQTFAKNSSLVLEKLNPEEDTPSGCGCSVVNSKDETLVFSDIEEKAPVTIRLNGEKHVLKWVSSTGNMTKLKKGDRFAQSYSDGKTKLKLDYKVTFTCPKNSEDCEVTRYSVDSTVEKHGKTGKMKSLKGDCGC